MEGSFGYFQTAQVMSPFTLTHMVPFQPFIIESSVLTVDKAVTCSIMGITQKGLLYIPLTKTGWRINISSHHNKWPSATYVVQLLSRQLKSIMRFMDMMMSRSNALTHDSENHSSSEDDMQLALLPSGNYRGCQFQPIKQCLYCNTKTNTHKAIKAKGIAKTWKL